MRSRVLGILTLFLLPICLFAQEDDWFWDKPVKDFVFEGLVTISSAELRPLVRPYIGQPFTRELFADVRDKLYALDYFNLIEGTAKPGDEERSSVIVELVVEERATVGAVEFRGNAGIRRATLLDSILTKKSDMLSEPLIDIDAQTIRELYLEKGYTNAVVSSGLEIDEETNSATVTFDIDEGSQTKISLVQFSGNVFAGESSLRRLMKTKKQSLLSAGDFQEGVLEEDKQLIREYYAKNGYIDADVVEVDRRIVVDEETGKTLLELTLYIEEGEQYTFGGLEFEGNELFDTEQLTALVRVQPGTVLNLQQLQADIAKIVDLYYADGYLTTAFTPEERRDDGTNQIGYVLHIRESDRVHIENIFLSGNTKTRDYVILRELPVEEGDVYSIERVRQGIYNLHNLQFFSAVDAQVPAGSAAGLSDLVISVEEQTTASFDFGVNFAVGEYPISGKVGWSEANFLGRGLGIGVHTELSNVKQNVTFNFTEPYLFGHRWSGGVNLLFDHSKVRKVPQDILAPVFTSSDGSAAVPDPYDGHLVYADTGEPYVFISVPADQAALDQIISDENLVTDYEYAEGVIPSAYTMEYDTFSISLGLRTGVRIPTAVAGEFRIDPYFNSALQYKTYDPLVYRPFDAGDREGLRTWIVENMLGVSFAWDTRDYFVNPQKGFYLTQNLVSVGGPLLGHKHYIKTRTLAEGYLTVLSRPVTDTYSFKIILGVHSSLSFILPQWKRNTSDPANPFWEWGRVIATGDKLYLDGMTNARGWRNVSPGQAMWESQLEVRIPISEQLLWFALFFDGAGVWNTPADMASMDINDYYFSFGGGLRFTHPQFPIRLYLSKGFRIDPTEGLVWKQGDLDMGALSLDFVISLGGMTF